MQDDIDSKILKKILEENRKSLCDRIRRATRAITLDFNNAFTRHGIRGTQFSMLVGIKANEGKNVTDMARLLCLERTSLERRVRPLLKLGLLDVEIVKRASVSGPRFSKLYTINKKGIELISSCYETLVKINKNQKNRLCFSEEEYDNLLKMLEIIEGI